MFSRFDDLIWVLASGTLLIVIGWTGERERGGLRMGIMCQDYAILLSASYPSTWG
jgi:hypothetical protein